jgi:pyruvate,water dikinase
VPQSYLYDLKSHSSSSRIGSKAEGLRFLRRCGFRVPTTYVCPWDAYILDLAGNPEVTSSLRSNRGENRDPNRTYAVRSSTNVEDGLERSFAGQFRTILHVGGVDAVLQAIQDVWASARSPEVTAYLQRTASDPSDVKVGVIVQEMVTPKVSGVAFSKNPITTLDEVILEAVPG